MFRFRLGQRPRFGYVRPQVQGAPRCLTVSITTTYYPIAKLSYCASPTRGIFSEKKEMKEPNPADIAELEFAILRGDRIGDTTKSVQSSVPRRALIVAPVYDDHETVQTPGIRWMPSTIRDAVLMHKTLMDRGYDPANIRILADGFKFNGASDPTRENIMYSLNWLVDGVGPGDYRFFHFSGHGVRTDSEKGKGKEVRKVFEGGKPGSGDTERRAFLGKPSGRLLSQIIKSSERVYYNEALVARISGGIHGEPTQGPPFYIYDWELNNVFAGLPKGSNLTVSPNVKGVSCLMNFRDQCVIDSCASGRIFNNAVKLEGAGFRGPESKGAVNSVTQGLRNALDAVTSPFRTTEKIEMQEELPSEERDMDRIQANMFTWAACHQRQDSVNYADLRSGLFTRLWTEALQKDTNRTLRIGELFKDVSAETLTLGDKEKAWQYVQLWTSTANGDPELQKQILQKPVII